MRSLQEHINSYRAYHQTRFTKATHAFAIPMLLFSVLLFFSWIRIDFATHWQIDIAWLIVLGLVIYYLCLNVGLGILMALFLGLLSWLADWVAGPSPNFLNISIFLVLFVLSNVLILYAHLRKEKHASVKKNFYHFSLAPLLLVIDLLEFLKLHKFSD